MVIVLIARGISNTCGFTHPHTDEISLLNCDLFTVWHVVSDDQFTWRVQQVLSNKFQLCCTCHNIVRCTHKRLSTHPPCRQTASDQVSADSLVARLTLIPDILTLVYSPHICRLTQHSVHRRDFYCTCCAVTAQAARFPAVDTHELRLRAAHSCVVFVEVCTIISDVITTFHSVLRFVANIV